MVVKKYEMMCWKAVCKMDDDQDIFPAEYRAALKAQAAELKTEASELGLQIDVYLVPSIAEWVLNQVEKGRFRDPKDAIFVAMQVFIEMEQHPDLHQELLRREIAAGLADEGPTFSSEEVLAILKEEQAKRSMRTPPVWRKVPFPSS